MSSKRTQTSKRFSGKISDKAFVDYDPKKDTREYDVYRNDIKFKKHRNVDPKRARWNDDVKKDFYEKNTDDIDYRIEECMREKFETLDLSHMNSECFNQLANHKLFKIIKRKVQHIFANDSHIKVVPDLRGMEKLLTLDLSRNKLRSLPELPETLEELILKHNKLTEINNDLPSLKRLNITDNQISQVNFSNSLESMYISNNPIDDLPRLSNLYYLDASTTKISSLNSYPKLKYLDCQYTNVDTIPAMPLLKHLLCSHSSVADISALRSLESLTMVDTKITRIHYIPSLYTVKYHEEDVFKLSKQYKVYGVMKNKRNITEIIFRLPPDQLKTSSN